MRRFRYYGDRLDDPRAPAARGRTARDVLLVLLAVAAVVAIAAHAPTNLYAYAQLRRVSSAVSMLRTGDWLLPVNQTTEIASKPQLYPWLTALGLRLTGVYDELVFRWPTIAATFLTAGMVYVLGRRWYGRAVGLMAAGLWATCLHMGRMAYLAATDMLLTACITASVLCADRLLYHRAPRRRRWLWAAGLWASIILGALSKGWGVVNLALVGLTLALASCLGPGFASCRAEPNGSAKLRRFFRLLGRRLWRTIRATYLGWGLLAMAAVLGPIWAAMLLQGGQEFRNLIYFEFVQRITGAGAGAPAAASAPAAVSLLYYTLPASALAIGALLLAAEGHWRPVALATRDHWRRLRSAGGLSRRQFLLGSLELVGFTVARAGATLLRSLGWLFSARDPICLPFCWTVAVVLPFSLTHGFRPDYLLPCYAAVALMAAWSVETVLRRREGASWLVRALRHGQAAVAILVGLGAAGVAAWYLHKAQSEFLVQTKSGPAVVLPDDWRYLYTVVAGGLIVAGFAVRNSLRWQMRHVAALAILGMLGVAFLYTHILSRHARSGDGEAMRQFALIARKDLWDRPFAVYRTNKLSVEPYLGRLGVHAEVLGPEAAGGVSAERRLAELADGRVLALAPRRGQVVAGKANWLITCDRGLCELGACREDPHGQYVVRVAEQTELGPRVRKVRVRTLPEALGQVRSSSLPIQSQNWGRIYFIALDRQVRIAGRPIVSVWESGKRDDENEEE